MYQIDNILIDEEIAGAKFSCDLQKCKGACCTFPGEYGAPLLDNEIELMKEAYPAAKEYLSPRSIKIIESEGFYEGKTGDLSTKCIDKKDCVFVYYTEEKIAKCAIEKAYFDGKTEFRKPISCHLFPIRVGNFGGPYLYYEKFIECRPGVKSGKENNIELYQSLKESLTRAYGAEWYEKLDKLIQEKLQLNDEF